MLEVLIPVLLLLVSALLILGLFYVAHKFTPMGRIAVALNANDQRTMRYIYAGAWYLPLSYILIFLLGRLTVMTPFILLHLNALFILIGCECAWSLIKMNKWNRLLFAINVLAGAICLSLLVFGYTFG